MEVQPDRSPLARSGAFHRPDGRGMGTENEVSLLLAAHVRYLKPRVIVETGTFRGDTTEPMLAALCANAEDEHGGSLYSFEVDPTEHEHARRRLDGYRPPGANLHLVLNTLQEHLRQNRLPGKVDLAFVDSAYAARDDDVTTLAPLMAPGGLLFVHDARMNAMLEQVARWRRAWNVVEYQTPRGLVVLQRR